MAHLANGAGCCGVIGGTVPGAPPSGLTPGCGLCGCGPPAVTWICPGCIGCPPTRPLTPVGGSSAASFAVLSASAWYFVACALFLSSSGVGGGGAGGCCACCCSCRAASS